MAETKGAHRLVILSTYQTRGFRLAPGEALPADARDFDRRAHEATLVQLVEGDVCQAIGTVGQGQVLAWIEKQGQPFACVLHSGSFELTAAVGQ